MQQDTTNDTALTMGSRDVLTEILRQGAQQMLAAAIENEVAEYIAACAEERDGGGHRLVVRNGHMPPRSILTGVGAVEVHRPRVDDRRTDAAGGRLQFTSKILPPYLRRTKAIDELVPWLYLKGISTGDFPEALQALLGPSANEFGAIDNVHECSFHALHWKEVFNGELAWYANDELTGPILRDDSLGWTQQMTA